MVYIGGNGKTRIFGTGFIYTAEPGTLPESAPSQPEATGGGWDASNEESFQTHEDDPSRVAQWQTRSGSQRAAADEVLTLLQGTSSFAPLRKTGGRVIDFSARSTRLFLQSDVPQRVLFNTMVYATCDTTNLPNNVTSQVFHSGRLKVDVGAIGLQFRWSNETGLVFIAYSTARSSDGNVQLRQNQCSGTSIPAQTTAVFAFHWTQQTVACWIDGRRVPEVGDASLDSNYQGDNLENFAEEDAPSEGTLLPLIIGGALGSSATPNENGRYTQDHLRNDAYGGTLAEFRFYHDQLHTDEQVDTISQAMLQKALA